MRAIERRLAKLEGGGRDVSILIIDHDLTPVEKDGAVRQHRCINALPPTTCVVTISCKDADL